jgi:hypothetical protein
MLTRCVHRDAMPLRRERLPALYGKRQLGTAMKQPSLGLTQGSACICIG